MGLLLTRRKGLDFHGRIRLVNYIRKQVCFSLFAFVWLEDWLADCVWVRQKATAQNVAKLTGKEPFFTSDDYLIPAVEDDPYLRGHLQHRLTSWQPLTASTELPSDEPWSDDEAPADSTDPQQKVKVLEAQLQDLQRKLAQMDIFNERWDTNTEGSGSVNTMGKKGRDDDSHYFQSYGEHGTS